ncbi:hypothetical protein SUGI_0902840 [Cryptomeria japonica]|nr:hypothetical protein SUGI_0902840 [Cryptomeria japonica]
MHILEGNLRFMDDFDFYVKDWEPSFNPINHTMEKVLKWIKLHNLPSKFWSANALRAISKELGSLVKVDNKIIAGHNRSFIRICVELYLASE